MPRGHAPRAKRRLDLTIQGIDHGSVLPWNPTGIASAPKIPQEVGLSSVCQHDHNGIVGSGKTPQLRLQRRVAKGLILIRVKGKLFWSAVVWSRLYFWCRVAGRCHVCLSDNRGGGDPLFRFGCSQDQMLQHEMPNRRCKESMFERKRDVLLSGCGQQAQPFVGDPTNFRVSLRVK